jgi:site-specific recombinase XerD
VRVLEDRERVASALMELRTRLLAKGVDILPVSQLLGHDSIVITAAYYPHTTALQYAKYLE